MSEEKNNNGQAKELTSSDYKTDRMVKWCPGCGDHAILNTIKKMLVREGLPPEKCVFISGIGCSSRLPYYINTYGFHSLHGRAPSIATGIKIANPDLSVWIITGDGDALSIGGNHFIHLLRRNLDINILLFNNRIYGLTKGQYSPTSEFGKITKSTPIGSPDRPLNPISLALGAEGTFVSRALDIDQDHLGTVLSRAVKHKGTSFVEIYQNCNIFNKDAFEYVRDRSLWNEARVLLEHGKPMIFGDKRDKGLKLKSRGISVVEFNPDDPLGPQKADVTIFDCHNPNLALLLTRLPPPPKFPVPMGVFYRENRATVEETLSAQADEVLEQYPRASTRDEDIRKLYHDGDTWTVE